MVPPVNVLVLEARSTPPEKAWSESDPAITNVALLCTMPPSACANGANLLSRRTVHSHSAREIEGLACRLRCQTDDAGKERRTSHASAEQNKIETGAWSQRAEEVTLQNALRDYRARALQLARSG